MAFKPYKTISGPGAALVGKASTKGRAPAAAPGGSWLAGALDNSIGQGGFGRSIGTLGSALQQPYRKVTPAPNIDISQRGDAENAYRAHGSKFFEQGPVETLYQQHGQDFLRPDANQQLWERQQAAGPMVNNAQREYNSFRKPNIAAEPGFGSYYDNAQTNTVNALNTQLGARGAYGSSVGLGQIGKSITDLRADQARNEAQYNLDRLGEQRQWNALGGDLARSADLSSMGNLAMEGTLAQNASTSQRQGLEGALGAASLAGNERRANLMGGMTAAGMSQNAREGRVQGGLGNLLGIYGGLSGLIGDAYGGLLGADSAGLDAYLTGQLGGKREAANYDSSVNPFSEALQYATGGFDIADRIRGFGSPSGPTVQEAHDKRHAAYKG